MSDVHGGETVAGGGGVVAGGKGGGGGTGGGGGARGHGGDRAELVRITVSLTVVCLLGAALLGGVFLLTDRYQRQARLSSERRSIVELLHLGPGASIQEVRQFLARPSSQVVYEVLPSGGAAAPAQRLIFALDGRLISRGQAAVADPAEGGKELSPLGRIFVATQSGRPAGFVVEGTTQGYKNRIRFLVALSGAFEVEGVRVLEHEEDPGLGAEVATPVFCAQYAGRTADELARTDVTRDPMPEDWHVALASLELRSPEAWNREFGPLRERERTRPIYAVTGATISSRALTHGVQATVNHFRRRWELLSTYLSGVAS